MAAAWRLSGEAKAFPLFLLETSDAESEPKSMELGCDRGLRRRRVESDIHSEEKLLKN